MSIALYPALQALSNEAGWQTCHTGQAIEACAEAYPFPVNMEMKKLITVQVFIYNSVPCSNDP